MIDFKATYLKYIQENNLNDDSAILTLNEMEEFIFEQIEKEEWVNDMVDDVLKVIDIHARYLKPETKAYLNGLHAYEDTLMEEHLYECELSEIEQEPLPEIVMTQLLEFKDLCDKYGAAYFRFFDVNYDLREKQQARLELERDEYDMSIENEVEETD